jgi:hypothetical protein
LIPATLSSTFISFASFVRIVDVADHSPDAVRLFFPDCHVCAFLGCGLSVCRSAALSRQHPDQGTALDKTKTSVRIDVLELPANFGVKIPKPLIIAFHLRRG